jgi:hypothetical protein
MEAPPPPPQAAGFFLEEEEPPPAPVRQLPRPQPAMRFDAELDVSELDDRDRPGPCWSARGRELSRAHMTFRSRRMCYVGKRVLAAVHLIDDRPVPLFGKVTACEYDNDGLYRVDIDLMTLPEKQDIANWLDARAR